MEPLIKNNCEYYLNKIRNNEYFSFARFGDGEVLAMFESKWAGNCDGAPYLKELREPMKQIFLNKYPYYHCLLYCTGHPYIKSLFGEEIADKFYALIDNGTQYYDGEIWQEYAFKDRIAEITYAISDKPFCLIGSSKLVKMLEVDGINKENAQFVVVNDRTSFKDTKRVIDEIMDYYDEGVRMFCFSAGYSTKIWIDMLWPVYGGTAFFIDFGSVFDPFCGKLSRSGMVEKGLAYYQQFTKHKL